MRYVPRSPVAAEDPRGSVFHSLYTRRSNDTVEIIDLRMTVVARLNTDCAKAVWKTTQRESEARVNLC